MTTSSDRTVLYAVAATTLAAAAVGAVGFVAYNAGRRSANPAPRRAPTDPNPGLPKQHRSQEPLEGHEERWRLRSGEALATCRDDPEVLTYAQAVTCALNVAFPEGAPWVDPGVWSGWMGEAAELARSSVAVAASRDGGSPRAWEILLWLRGDRELSACGFSKPPYQRLPGALAVCAAQRLYPGADWASPHRLPWQDEFLSVLTGMARHRVT